MKQSDCSLLHTEYIIFRGHEAYNKYFVSLFPVTEEISGPVNFFT